MSHIITFQEARPSPSQRPSHLYYWSIDTTQEQRVNKIWPGSLPADKPLVFFFGGIPVMSVINHAPEVSIRNEIASYLKNISPGSFALTMVTESSGYEKPFLADHYNADPEHYFSANAREFVEKTLMPMIKDAQTLEDIKKQFSRVNLIGHSYGTVFIQNISNALLTVLQENSSLNVAEIREAMSCIAALNIGPTCAIANKEADFTQLFAVSEQDQTSTDQVNYAAMVDDNHPVLSHQRIGSNLLLLSKGMGKHLLKISSQNQQLCDETTIEDGGHSLRLYMNVTEDVAASDARPMRTFQVNPSAGILRGFLDAAIKTSLESLGSSAPRDTEKLLNDIEATHLTTEAKDAIGQKLEQDKRTMAKFILASGMAREL